MNNELLLNGIVYDLNKVKEKDEYTFLMACQELGSYTKIKGFLNKTIYVFILFFSNPLEMEATNEYRKAYFFFQNRRRIKEKFILNKLMKSIEKK
jgi:hypothetical protein